MLSWQDITSSSTLIVDVVYPGRMTAAIHQANLNVGRSVFELRVARKNQAGKYLLIQSVVELVMPNTTLSDS